jgi:hypothetical protein
VSPAPPGLVSPRGSPRWFPFLVRLLRRLPRSLVRFEASEIMAAPTSRLRLFPRVPKAFTVRPADAGDAELLHRFFGASAASRVPSAQDACIVAVGEGEIHAVEWVWRGPSAYDGDTARLVVRMRVPAGSCWLHNGRNAGSEQVVGPWGMIMGRLRALLEPEGVGRLFLQVDTEDAYSVACHESLGFRSVGCVAALRLLGGVLVAFRPLGGGWSRLDGELDLSRLEV